MARRITGGIAVLAAILTISPESDRSQSPESAFVTEQVVYAPVSTTIDSGPIVPIASGTPAPVRAATERERAALAGLCWVEVRGMGNLKDDACLSVVSTVMTRVDSGIMSDGTIRGALTRGCDPGATECQFPAWVWNGCEGIAWSVCPASDPAGVRGMRAVVDRYFDTGQRGSCDGYLYYGIKHFDAPEC